VSVQLHGKAAVPQGKIPWYPFDKRLSGPQSRSGRGGEEKNSQPPQGFKLPIIQPIAQRYTAELSRLLTILVTKNFESVHRHAAYITEKDAYSQTLPAVLWV
jgi:hypothetical protein